MRALAGTLELLTCQQAAHVGAMPWCAGVPAYSDSTPVLHSR